MFCLHSRKSLLTKRISDLDRHLQQHKTVDGNYKDKHSYRGLEKIINQRRSFQKYYKRKNPEGYAKLIKELGYNDESKNIVDSTSL